MSVSLPEIENSLPKKRCCLCREELPVSAFSRSAGTKDGFQTQCKACASKRWAAYRQNGSCRPLRPVRPAQAGKRVCIKCHMELDLSEFYNGYSPEKRQYLSCKRCESAAVSARHARNPERQHERGLRRYGLTITDFNALLKKQDGCCAICGGGPNGGRRNLCVDHDHETGVVRGLLCAKCNRVIGLFGDNAAQLEKAVAYLRKERQP